MSSETLFINRQKASWCVSKWWEAGDCSLYKWVQNMIKRNCRALRKNNACAIIILTQRTVAHSSVLSCREPVPTLCESRGRLCTWFIFGVGLRKILELLINSMTKAVAVYIKAGLAERHKSADWNVPALALCMAETFHMLTFPGKLWLERHEKGRRQRVASASESSSSLSRLRGQLFALQTKQGRDSACKMPVISLLVCSIAPFMPQVNAIVCRTNPLFIFFPLPSPFPPLNQTVKTWTRLLTGEHSSKAARVGVRSQGKNLDWLSAFKMWQKAARLDSQCPDWV